LGLTFNPNTSDYMLVSNDRERAEIAGLTLANKVRGPSGELVWFTQSPYAVLDYWDEADARARVKMESLKRDYDLSWQKDSTTDYPRPANLNYMPFQRAGIAYGLAHNNCLIADEMGLGKTVQAIGICNAIEAKKVLVICPASIRLNWRREIRKWSTINNGRGEGVRTYPIIKGGDGVAPWTNYLICSYDLTRNEALHEALRQFHWDAIIVDEAHFLKSHTAGRTHALFGGGRKLEFKNALSAHSDRVIALTGTPLPNRPRECYTLAKALCWDAIDFMSFDQFCYRFNPSARMVSEDEDTGMTKIWNLEKRGRLPELQARLRCNLMIRRLKADVLTDLPDKRYELTYIEGDATIKDIIRRERMLDYTLEDLKQPGAEMFGQISTLRREMGEAKLPRAIDHIRSVLDIEEAPKIVVFSHHKSVMDGLKQALWGYGIVEYRGGMGDKAKENSVHQFQQNPKIRIFSGQMDSAGFGVDGLQDVCSRALFIEPAWVPGINDQCVDRLHRYGQHANVVAQFLVVEGSLDERVLATVFDKTHTIHQSLDRRTGV